MLIVKPISASSKMPIRNDDGIARPMMQRGPSRQRVEDNDEDRMTAMRTLVLQIAEQLVDED